MKFISHWVKSQDAYLLPLGDIHVGDKAFTKQSLTLLQEKIDFVKKRSNARIVGMGDWLNVATRTSKSSPFEQNMDLEEQIEMICKIFEPVKEKIIGLIDGNHEQRIADHAGYSPTIAICDRLKVPYLGTSAVLDFRVGVRNKESNQTSAISYIVYAHHTTAGGRTIGSKINRTALLAEMVANADIYLGAHSHEETSNISSCYLANPHQQEIVELIQYFVDCGSFLEWKKSYAERIQMKPMPMGSPTIWFRGTRLHGLINKEIKISL